jgi:hypothetical protein
MKKLVILGISIALLSVGACASVGKGKGKPPVITKG